MLLCENVEVSLSDEYCCRRMLLLTENKGGRRGFYAGKRRHAWIAVRICQNLSVPKSCLPLVRSTFHKTNPNSIRDMRLSKADKY